MNEVMNGPLYLIRRVKKKPAHLPVSIFGEKRYPHFFTTRCIDVIYDIQFLAPSFHVIEFLR